MFLTAALLLTAEASLGACGAECGAAAAFRKEEISIFYALSFFLHFDILPLF